MKKFTQNKIEHKMPHTLPKADFFELFPKELFAKIEAEKIYPIPPNEQNVKVKINSRIKNSTQLLIASGIAAALVIGLIISSKNNTCKDEFAIKRTLVNNIDSYLYNLSDEEFNNLHTTSMKQSDFYLNLPNF